MSVLLIDGNSIAYRAYFALIRSPLRNSEGRNTSAVFGFANSLVKLLARFQPSHAAVAFDPPGPTFRRRLYEHYKSQRPTTPPELADQLPVVKQLVGAFGLAAVEVPEFEADDVLGTLAAAFRAPLGEIVLVSSDKDLLQLVDAQVHVFDPFKELLYDPEHVRRRYGVGPEQVADLLALCGDASDNIPGVPGIGEKRALALLLRYGSLDQALAQDSKLAPWREQVRMSRTLTGIRTDVPLPGFPADGLLIHARDTAELIRLFKRLEFTSLLRELVPPTPDAITVVSDQAAVEDALQQLSRLPRVGIALDGQWCCLVGPDRASKTPGVTDTPSRLGVSDTAVAVRVESNSPQLVSGILLNPQILKVGFDLKPLLKYYQPLGVRPWPIADPMVAAWLLDPNQHDYDLARLMLRHTDQVIPVHPQASPERRAACALTLFERIEPDLHATGLHTLFQDLEMPLEYVLADMELRGVRLDKEQLFALARQLADETAGLEHRIQDQAGAAFNLRSPQQLSDVLFHRLGLKPGRRTRTGYSTEASVLQGLVTAHPIVADILRWRELEKLQSTYLEPLARMVVPETGRIHTNFVQTGTATGRLSANTPNLQNVPVRSDLGRLIRRAFIAAPDRLLISADYSQLELRILAELADEPELKAAFAQGADIHIRTAAALLGCREDQVTPEARRLAKTVNYGIIYGMSEHGLAQRLGIELEAARQFIASYFARYSRVAAWTDSVIAQAAQTGIARTAFGRIRPISGLRTNAENTQEPQESSPASLLRSSASHDARRAAVNTPIQGTAADIIKRAMVLAHQRLSRAGYQGGLVLQVHDELLLEIEQPRVHEAAQLVQQAMTEAWPIQPQLTTQTGIGPNWADIH